MKSNILLKFSIVIIIFISSFSFNVKCTYGLNEKIDNLQSIDRIEKHWWGYRRYISNEQISKITTDIDFIAAEIGFLGEATLPISFLNPLAGIIVSSVLEISSSYYWLVSTYLVKVNKGNGVVIDFNNGLIFRIKPL